MNTRLRLTAVSVLTMALAQCGGDPLGPIDELPRDLSRAETRLIEIDNSFGLKLFREINAQDPGKNLFVSPLPNICRW